MSEIEKIISTYDDVQRRLKGSPLLFGHYYCSQYFPSRSPSFHAKLSNEMMIYNRLAVAAPRESAKSTISSFLKTLHAVCYRHKRHIIIIQNTLSKSCSSLYAVKHQLQYNDGINRDFGIEFIRDAKEECIVQYPDGEQARILCKGYEQMGSIRGERFNELRPDLIIIDDLEDDEMVKSPERRRDLQDVYDDAVEPAVDRKRGQIIFIGTVLHDDSLISKVVNKDMYKEFRKLKYKALHNDVSLWEEKWSVDELKAIEASKPEKFAKEYQNDPVSGVNRSFNKEDFRYWSVEEGNAILFGADGRIMRRYLLSDCVAAIGCDLAWEEKKRNDYTAVIPGLLTPDDDILFDDYFCKKGVRPNTFLDMLFSMEAKYRAMTGSSVYIGFEKAKLEKVMKWLAGQEMRRRGEYLILKDVKWDGDKISRIVTTLEPRYSNHTIFHKRGYGEYEYQLLRVPEGVHDDLPDAAQVCVKLLKYPKTKKKEVESDNHFNWLLRREKAKKSRGQYVFGQKDKRDTFPFKTHESFI